MLSKTANNLTDVNYQMIDSLKIIEVKHSRQLHLDPKFEKSKY